MHRLLSAAGRALGAAAARLARPNRRVRDAAALLPALLAGAGVFLVVAGLFNYFGPGAGATPTPVGSTATSALFTLPPLTTESPSPTQTQGSYATATRLVVAALNIDLPILRPGPNERYPFCDAAEYLVTDRAYGYPGASQATYLYAHARDGMFGPFLQASKVNDGASLIGLWVEVYTADNQRHVYEITRVLPHVPNSAAFLNEASSATTDQLWMQTSEGHADTSSKLQVVAMPVGVVAAASPADAHPTATGKICPDAPICTSADQTGCRKP